MKFVKQLTALFLAVCMVMAMGITAFAEGETGNSDQSSGTAYTISTGSNDTHTYKVYQIFTGDVTTKDGKTVLSNVQAGKNFNANNAAGDKKEDLTAAEAAEALAKIEATSDSEELDEILKFVTIDKTEAEGDAFASVSSNSPATVAPGYYLIKDTNKSLDGGDDAYTTYVVKVASENVTITRKADKPTVEKKVKDVNDSDGSGKTGWQDSADHDIDDKVNFQLKATLPTDANDFAAYKTYELVFHDKQSTGLTFDGDAKVYYLAESETDETKKVELNASDYEVKYTADSEQSDKCTFEVVVGKTVGNIRDAKSVRDTLDDAITVTAGGRFLVEYTSTLNSNAVIGAKGNPNEVYLEYSNNPNAAGKGKTSNDKVIVFTYTVKVNKVTKTGTDENKNDILGPVEALKDAKFTLYKATDKKNESDKTKWEWEVVKANVQVQPVYDKTDGTKVVSYTATYTGIDDGEYKLVETNVPAGYSKADDVYFTVTAEHDTTSDDPKLTKLNDGNNIWVGKVDAGTVTGSVENKPGSALPETGGMGTTVIYIAGIAMIVTAGVVVIARKRMA